MTAQKSLTGFVVVLSLCLTGCWGNVLDLGPFDPDGGAEVPDAAVAPTRGLTLAATPLSPSEIRLDWSMEDVASVAGYDIVRDDVVVGTAQSVSYGDQALTAATSYRYRVRAYDAAHVALAESNEVTVSTAAAGGFSIPITVQELLTGDAHPLARANEPFTAGIPLYDADGVTDVDQLALLGSGVSQFRVLDRYPSGNVRWVLVDGQASIDAGTTATVTLTRGGGGSGGAALAQDLGTTIAVNTGAAVFTIRKANFDFLHSVTVGGLEALGGDPGAITSTDATDTAYRSDLDPNSTAIIEENGPARTVIKATGLLTSSLGTGHLWFTARLSFFHGATYVKASITYRNADRNLASSQEFNDLGVSLQRAVGTDVSATFPNETEVSPFVVPLSSASATAHVFQGYSTYRSFHTIGGCYGWTPPAAGTCDSAYVYTFDPAASGFEVVGDGTTLQAFGDRRRYTQGWADLRDGSGQGVTAALRWMSGFWPASFDFDGSGHLEVGVYSRHNTKKPLKYRWGSHDTRELLFDFGPTTGVQALYRLQHPLGARAPFEHYRLTGAWFGQQELVTNAEEKEYFQSHGLTEASVLNTLNRTESESIGVMRIEHWRRGYPEHEHGLYAFLRDGLGSRWLSADQHIQFNADAPVAHSDGFDLGPEVTFEPLGGVGQNPFDEGHQETMSFPIYYFLTGDQRIREAIDDYGEWLLRQQGTGNFTLPGTPAFRPWCRRFRNLTWLYEFTHDPKYLPPVRAALDFLIDRRVDPAVPKSRGRDLQRGFIYMNADLYTSLEYRAVHTFFDAQIFGEAAYQVLRVLRDHPEMYPRLEEYEDALLGEAQFIWREAAWVGPNLYWLPYDYNLDQPNLKTKFEVNAYGGSRWLFLLYEMLGDTDLFAGGAQVQYAKTKYIKTSESLFAQNQALMYVDLHRPPPLKGWTRVPFTAADNGDGSYTLRWTVPAGAKAYKVKYADKPIVDWLGFDQVTRTFQLDPASHVPFFAATNVNDEPAPAAAGTEQTFTVTGLTVGTAYSFDLRARF